MALCWRNHRYAEWYIFPTGVNCVDINLKIYDSCITVGYLFKKYFKQPRFFVQPSYAYIDKENGIPNTIRRGKVADSVRFASWSRKSTLVCFGLGISYGSGLCLKAWASYWEKYQSRLPGWLEWAAGSNVDKIYRGKPQRFVGYPGYVRFSRTKTERESKGGSWKFQFHANAYIKATAPWMIT